MICTDILIIHKKENLNNYNVLAIPGGFSYGDDVASGKILAIELASFFSKELKKFISRKILPDDAIFVFANNTLFIIEVKFQKVAGSTDEKLQTCDFKIKQYRKLLAQLNVEVQYIYVLNKWFEKPEYKDVLDYIISISGCFYYFEYLPLQKLGLPVPKN